MGGGSMKCGRGRKSHIRLTDLTVLHAGGGAYTHGNALTDHGHAHVPISPFLMDRVRPRWYLGSGVRCHSLRDPSVNTA